MAYRAYRVSVKERQTYAQGRTEIYIELFQFETSGLTPIGEVGRAVQLVREKFHEPEFRVVVEEAPLNEWSQLSPLAVDRLIACGTVQYGRKS